MSGDEAAWPKVADVSRIAVLRANGLGDLVFALPAYVALKAAYPQAELVLLATPWHAGFLTGRPGAVDRVEVVPISQGVRVEPGCEPDEEELELFLARMRAERFDLAVQLHGGGRYSNPFVRRLGARVTVGRRTEDAVPLDRWIPYWHYQHEVFCHLETVGLAGAPPVELQPRLALVPRDLEELARHFDLRGKRFVVLAPGATDPRRRWPCAKFAAVGTALQRDGWDVVLTGRDDEQALLDELSAGLPGHCTKLTGLTLGAFAALLSHAALVVGNDSGPAHLARALRTPGVIAFWGPNLVKAGPLYRERDRVAVSWQITCSVCGCNFGHSYPYAGDDCGHRVSLLDPIPVVEVLDEARSLLAQQS